MAWRNQWFWRYGNRQKTTHALVCRKALPLIFDMNVSRGVAFRKDYFVLVRRGYIELAFERIRKRF